MNTVELANQLGGIPIPSLIEWLQWNDPELDCSDMSFNDLVIVAFECFESLEEVGQSRYRFLSETE